MPSKLRAKKVDVVTTKRSPVQTSASLPDWPLLQPLIPTAALSLETLLQDQIIVIRNLLTSTLCRKYVSFLSSLPLITTPIPPEEGNALRVNDRIQLNDPAFAELLWTSTALKDLVAGSTGHDSHERLASGESKQRWGGEVCGLNPRIRIYRYAPGHFFGQHYDESNVITLPGNPPVPARTTWTLLIYLQECIGGETVFYPELGPARKFSGRPSHDTEPVAVRPEVGMALLHKHGQECLLHEGREVKEGVKWIIRSDLCIKR